MKIGICVPDFGFNQLNYYLVKNSNEQVEINKISFIGFYENLSPTYMKTNFPLMQMYEIFNYDGVLISTDLNTTNKVINAFSPAKRIFYIWDLEWLRLPKKNFSYIKDVYRNKNIKLIARSQEHKKAIENSWNRKVEGVVENFNYEQLLTYI